MELTLLNHLPPPERPPNKQVTHWDRSSQIRAFTSPCLRRLYTPALPRWYQIQGRSARGPRGNQRLTATLGLMHIPELSNDLNHSKIQGIRKGEGNALMSRLIYLMKQAKFHGAVIKKRTRWKIQLVGVPLIDPPFRLYQKIVPFHYEQGRYTGTFLEHSEPARDVVEFEPVPRVIYCVWTGNNPMSKNRVEGLADIRGKNPDVEVRLITPENIQDYVLPEFPLHPLYSHLSLVHRSDYLRGYLLHHYGGGYCDIKRIREPWVAAFDKLQASDKWLLGYTEVKFDMVPQVPGKIGRDLIRASTQMLGHGSYIARAKTPITGEWLHEMNQVLDRVHADLVTHPGDERGQNAGYPIRWTGILADVLSPIVFKYQDKVIHDDSIIVNFNNYR